MKELTNDEFNSWACDIANDYDQAWREMGPDDYESQEDYFDRRMKDAGIKPPKAYEERIIKRFPHNYEYYIHDRINARAKYLDWSISDQRLKTAFIKDQHDILPF